MRLRRTTVALCLVGMVATGGCDSLNGARGGSDHVDLVNDLATRLDHSGELTYTAEYQLPGGGTAEVMRAQDPARSAYVYPGRKVSMTPELVMDCRLAGTATTCTLSTPPSPPAEPDAALLATIAAGGLLPTNVVLELLFAAAVDSDATVEQHDTTIAGQHATCVEVTQVDNAAAAEYEICVTTDGVLGSFSGTVNGKAVELILTGYRSAVPADAFAVPSDARVVDQRGARP